MAQNTKLMQMDKPAIRPSIVISILGVDEHLRRRCRELDCIVGQLLSWLPFQAEAMEVENECEVRL